MIPQGAAAVITFFLLVAPGVTWELAGERSRPAISASNFREASRVALTSVIFSAIAVLVLLAVRAWIWAGSMPDVGAWLNAKGASPHYAQQHYALIARTLAVEVLLACGLAASIQFAQTFNVPAGFVGRPRRLRTMVRSWRKPQRVVQRPTLWTVIHQSGADARLVPMASVRLADGVIWKGDVAAIGHFESRADNDIALEGKIEVWRNGKRDSLDPATGWQRVVLPMASITEIVIGWRELMPNEVRRIVL